MSDLPLLIAVIDDDASVRTAMRRLLHLSGYDVATFESGEAFLAALPQIQAACALLDVQMPGLSGFEVAQAIRATSLHPPIVFMTANTDEWLQSRVDATAEARLLRKPFPTEALLATIEGLTSAARGGPKN